MSKAQIRVIIADDHPVFRFGLRTLLEVQPDIVVIGEAGDGLQAVQMAKSLKPDLLLMDINMPKLNGIEATKQVVSSNPETTVLMVTMIDDDTVYTAMQAGAKGYLLKGAEGDETLRAIRAVANGEVIFSPGVAEQLLHFFKRVPIARKSNPFPELTPREYEVLSLIAQGLTNKTIAEKLVLSPKTIRNLTSIIFSKLQVTNRSEAIIMVRDSEIDGKETN